MLNDQRGSTSHGDDLQIQGEDDLIRDIHALTPPPPPPPAANRNRRREAWETTSHRSSGSEGGSIENFTSMSREFNALVIAGAEIGNDQNNELGGPNNLSRIGEEDMPEEETNPLAIVPDNHPFDQSAVASSTVRHESSSGGGGASSSSMRSGQTEISLQMVKKEEVETKISAWQNAKIAKINNRFKREEAVISGWESEQVEKATSWMKKVERKLEEKRARALEKMQNEVAKAHRKAEERRASSEGKRGTKVAKVLEISNLMRAVGRPPAKRSFF